MLKRAFTGALFVALVVTCTLWSSWSLTGLLFLVTLLGAHELSMLQKKQQFMSVLPLLIISGMGFLLLPLHLQLSIPWPWLLLLFVIAILAWWLSTLFRINLTQPLQELSTQTFALLYEAFPLSALVALGFVGGTGYQYELVLLFFFLVWSNDTFAYLVGKSLGRTKLFERISPNKTWEGTLGGVVGAVLVAWLFLQYTPVIQQGIGIGMALIVGVFGSYGDLFQSMIKRSFNVKDSGNILPGHGGILDRFDGVFWAAPLTTAFVYWSEYL